MTHIKLAIMLTLARTVLNACLPSSFYLSLGLTAYISPNTTNVKICTNMYTQFGYCADQDQVIKMMSDKLYSQTRAILAKGDGLNRLLKRVDSRMDALVQNTKKIAGNATLSGSASVNGTAARRLLQVAVNTTTAVNATAGGNGTNTTTKASVNVNITLGAPPAKKNSNDTTQTFTAKDKTKVTRIAAKNMSLKNETLVALENFKANLTSQMGTIQKFANKDVRKACYKSLFRLYIGTTCVLTSGAATTYSTLNGNTMVSVKVAQTDAADVTTNCVQLLYPICIARKARATFANLTNNGVNNGADNGKKAKMDAVCKVLDNNPTCVQTPSSCTADIQNLVLKNMINSGDDPFTSDVDLQTTADLFDTADTSTQETITSNKGTAARRLQSDNGYGYETSSGAPSAGSEADKSNVPSDSVENNIATEVPASANDGTSTGSFKQATGLGALIALVMTVMN